MSEPTFEEGYIDTVKWGHYRYQFRYIDGEEYNNQEVYDWCLYNITSIMGWHVLWEGVVIFEEIDAMAFKLRWL